MSSLSRKTVRDAVASALSSSVTGSGKPVSSVYGYQPGKLNGESPVILVLSRSTQRSPRGMGSKTWDNAFDLELHVLVYDGENNPLTEAQREDKIDEIEAACADYFAANQNTATWRALEYTPAPTEITTVTYLDGNPYRLEVITLHLEAPDA